MGNNGVVHASRGLRGAARASRRGLAAALGLVLAAPVLATAPAEAGVLALVAPTPVIESGAPGSVELLGTVVCESDGTARKVCDALPVDGISDAALTVVLTAVPANAEDVPQWDPATCPGAVADLCTIPVSDLTGPTPLAPVVTFLSSGTTSGTDPGTGGDTPLLDTTITSAVPGAAETAHTFTFQATPDTSTTSFECKLQVTFDGTPPAGAQASHDWRPCGTDPRGSETYGDLADGDYVFAVRAVAGPVQDQSPATQHWTVALPVGDTGGTPGGDAGGGSGSEDIDTTVTAGPRSDSWVLGQTVTYRFTSNYADARFDCFVGDDMRACDTGSHRVAVWKLRGGTHRFTVQAFTFAGERDSSPARRILDVPTDDRSLKAVGPWMSRTAKGHFKNTFRQTAHKGAVLVTKSRQSFRKVALVADKGRRHGTVRVFWNKKLLKEVSLRAKHAQKARVIPIKRFTGKMRHGTLRVVVVSRGKVIRIDGLGIAAR